MSRTPLPRSAPADEAAAFARDGFVVVRGLFSPDEAARLRELARVDRELDEHVRARADAEGGLIRLALRNELPRDDAFAAAVRSRRVVERVAAWLDDEVYHFHHKIIYKDARDGGAWEWHQDYGYWYRDGCLAPDLASCLIALDPASRANGCLRVVPGSHRLGRVDHGPAGDQTGADPERVAAIVERFGTHDVELEPGDAAIFHANTLHRSDANRSDAPRWAFICCYNARSNDPYRESRHPRYAPLEIWDDDRLREAFDAHERRLARAVGADA